MGLIRMLQSTESHVHTSASFVQRAAVAHHVHLALQRAIVYMCVQAWHRDPVLATLCWRELKSQHHAVDDAAIRQRICGVETKDGRAGWAVKLLAGRALCAVLNAH